MTPSPRRLGFYYAALAAVTAVVAVLVLTAGADETPAPAIGGGYDVAGTVPCLGRRIDLVQSGQFVDLSNADHTLGGSLRFQDGRLTGDVDCVGGRSAQLEARVRGGQLAGALDGRPVRAERKRDLPPAGQQAPRAGPPRPLGELVASFFLVVAIVMVCARLAGAAAQRIGQPRVMGEVAAGILLGPTFLGAIAPELQQELFPADVIPFIGVVANLGLIFYMFLVGLELDPRQLKGRVSQAVAVSNTGVLIPMAAGIAIALPLYELVGPPTDFTGFALFLGVAMSITAFPVLARILVERRMLRRPIGALALASAAIDDVTAWFLIALATAIAAAGSGFEVVRTILFALAFCAAMFFGVRRLLRRASDAYDEAGRVPGAWVTVIFAGVLLAAFVTEEIGIAVIFGAFVMGAIMPRHAGFTEDVTNRIEDFVVVLLLPLFFAYTGLRTDMLLLDRPELWLLTGAILVVAVACKFGGTVLAARVTNMGWREAAVLGTLMNTRGLTELIVLNLALELGVISPALFAALVIMALVTTFMAGPVLRLLDPRNEFGEPVEEEVEEARGEGDRRPVILVAPQSDAAQAQLVPLAAGLAGSEPRREVIVARLIAPTRGAAARVGLRTENREVAEASAAAGDAAEALRERGLAARAVALRSSHPGRDLRKLASQEEVDLVLLDGRRPLLGAGVPRGAVGEVLREAPSDVAVLVAREEVVPQLDAGRPVVIPFGGAEHDWAALELGAWLAAAHDAPLQLLGTEESSRLLASASLLVQRFAGVAAEAVLTEPGPALTAAAHEAGLLVVGLSDRWREEGLGETRSAIARGGDAPILFVRRGQRPGALAPRTDVTQFKWSRVSLGAS